MYIYLVVTADKYELPIAVANSGHEVAEILGIKRESVYSMITRKQSVFLHGQRYRIVRVNLDKEEKITVDNSISKIMSILKCCSKYDCFECPLKSNQECIRTMAYMAKETITGLTKRIAELESERLHNENKG